MFDTIEIDLYLSEALALDELLENNRSIKKRINLLEGLKEEDYSLDQISYLILILFYDYLDKKEFSSINKIISSIDLNLCCLLLVITLLKFSYIIRGDLPFYNEFEAKVIQYLDNIDIDSTEVLKDVIK